jgi:hypothetical protein
MGWPVSRETQGDDLIYDGKVDHGFDAKDLQARLKR